VTTALDRPRVDERAVGAGTTVRFVLLTALLLATSGYATLYIAIWLSSYDSIDCSLAAGIDPNNSSAIAIGIARLSQRAAYQTCVARYAAPPAWWVPLAGPCALLLGAVLLFFFLAAWKKRGRRVVALATVDQDGAVRRMLDAQAARMGIRPDLVTAVVDVFAESTSAVVFGRNRRPVICLHGKLIASYADKPELVRAVVLHELAHIRNGDVTTTYLTVALWRVFLVVTLLPYVGLGIAVAHASMRSPYWPSYEPVAVRGFVLVAFLTLLVYLARSDVLRSRETYADLAALRLDVDPEPWERHSSAASTGRPRRAVGLFLDLWRTHPRWELRRDSLTDNAVLFGVRAIPLFLTGAAAALIEIDITTYLAAYNITLYGAAGQWTRQAETLAAAALVAGVAGVVVWRATLYAVLTEKAPPSGLRAGLWLGAGMATAELLMNQVGGNTWLLAQPEVLLVVVLAGVGFTWWVAHCARLWVSTWSGRSIRPIVFAGLIAGCVAFSWWFAWWESGGGAILTAGWPFSQSGVSQFVQGLFASLAGGHTSAVSTVSVEYAIAITLLSDLLALPLVLVAIGALWIPQLLAWTTRSTAALPEWVRTAVPNRAQATEKWFGGALPPLRRILVPGLLAGLSAWAGIAILRGHWQPWQPPPAAQAANFGSSYLAWTVVLIVAATILAAIVASALTGRHRLIAALVAAETTALIGTAGAYAFMSADGCVPYANVLVTTCGRVVGAGQAFQPLVMALLPPTLVGGALGAAVVAVIVTILARLVRRSAPDQPYRAGSSLALRRASVVVLCVVAVGATTTEVVFQVQRNSTQPTDANLQATAQRVLDSVVSTPSAGVLASQVLAWNDYGGQDLLVRFAKDWHTMEAIVPQIHQSTDLARFGPVCGDTRQVAQAAIDYFRVPDPQAQPLWQQFIGYASTGSKDCAQAIKLLAANQLDNAIGEFRQSFGQLGSAVRASRSLGARIDVVRRNGGQPGSPTITTFDPSTLDNQHSDRTPFTPASLLPNTFTDAQGVSYELVWSGSRTCVQPAMTVAVRRVLSQEHCATSMVGVYLNTGKSITANNQVLVSVQIFPFADEDTADQAYDALTGSDSWGYALWCAPSGPGSLPCASDARTATDRSKAEKDQFLQEDHRYLVEAEAIYTNLTASKIVRPWVDAAALQAATTSGPQN
jgi:Zn-dependent protease with chaperone function